MKRINFTIIFLFVGIFTMVAQQKKYITYKVEPNETVQTIADYLEISKYDLLKLNPDVIETVEPGDIIIIPNKNYLPEKDIENSDLSIIGSNDIVVDHFIYHEILEQETVYGLMKKFNVTTEELDDSNPLLAIEGLKLGEIIKIPIKTKKDIIEEKEKLTQPYIVKPKDTKYSIAKLYDITIDYLEELNPNIKDSGLQIGDIIMIPVKIAQKTDFESYTIQSKETLFSLSHKFGVSQEELISLNPVLEDGVNEGVVIKTPHTFKNEKLLFTEQSLDSTTLNIAMMLPFKSKRDSLDFENDRLLNITTDFYFGALQAIDSLKSKGMSINVQVYDTENDVETSKKISHDISFYNYDVILGPLFFKNVKAVSDNLENKNTMVISPISSKNHSNLTNLNLVQEVPSQDILTTKMLHHLKATYTNQKISIITDETEEVSLHFNLILKEIQALDSTQVKIIRPDNGYIKPDVFKETIKSGTENWILLVGKDQAFLRDIFNNLGVLPEENKFTLFSFNKTKDYDKINNNYLSRVSFHYPTANYLDRESQEFVHFKNKYIQTFHDYPSKHAIEGFDITYDTLLRLGVNNNFKKQGRSQRIATRFDFVENTSGSTINKGAYIVKHDQLNLTLVE